VLNEIGGYTAGLIPSEANHGGVLSNVPVMLGAYDIHHKMDGDENAKKLYLNGMMNSLKDTQGGANNLIGDDVDKMIWYNPTHGFFGDLLESGVDVIGNAVGIQTGVSKEFQKFQEEHKKLDIYMHSQGNAIAVAGAMDKHNYYSYGSPLSAEKTQLVYNPNERDDFIFQKNDGDYVANPLNIFNPFTWSEPGHGTENYGAAKLKKEKALEND
jgi:hypothetical protein